ncbi:hypothetical protein AM588_10000845 [Phytophthora nicotianae]|uniref:Uncharacterized protein n=1 Tax=Phytophthora nicotianae TaxID=4792 RepID=A0A0W8CMF3_PHYNI|nr:hypothetical protein AM588_10000845 [Phytophthora nicotianae]
MTRNVGRSDVSARRAREGNRDLSPRRRGPGLSDTQEAGVSEVAEAASNEEDNPLETGGGLAIPGNDRGSDDPDVEDVESGRASESNGGEEEDDGGFAAELALVPVEAPVNWHTSWEAWQTYFADYCQRTMQVLPVKETMSRAERNKRLKKTRKGGDDSQLVPEQFDPYPRTYICTHGWKKRKSRSEGSRPRQHIRLTDCSFRFVILWNLSRGELQLKNGTFVHNHRVSPAAFATYPASRGVADHS